MAAEGPGALAELVVEVEPRTEGDTLTAQRAIFFSDRAGAFFYDAAVAAPDDPAMGFTVNGGRILDGWAWWVSDDSTLLGAEERAHADIRPDFAIRSYVERDTSGFFRRLLNRITGDKRAEITEQITLLEEHGALLVEVPDSIGTVAFRPVFGEGQGEVIDPRGASLLVGRPAGSDTLWTAIRAEGGMASSHEVAFPTPGAVVVVTGRTANEADSLAGLVLRDADRLKTERGERLAGLLAGSYIRTENEEVNDTIAWARLTLDALVVGDSTEVVLMPGIPGAEPIPGRSILSNLNALLATGDWETARGLLVTYGRAQRFDERLDILGRAPNVVHPGGTGEFTTADATPIYLAAAGDYVRVTGDKGLVSGGSNFWFKTAFAMRGLYQESSRHGRQIGDGGFLSAANGETWMQSPSAKAELATPRGGFPVEVQGALYRSLRAAASFAEIMGVARREGSSWYADSADALLQQFSRRFVQDDRLIDRIDRQEQPDRFQRPNAVLALRDINLPRDEKAQFARTLADQLAYRHGLSTRVQSDSLFHPFLNEPSSYTPGDALFNGTVWTWLNGPLISVMVETGAPELASELFEEEATLVEQSGVVGAIPDNVDAHPREPGGQPMAGGTPVQPWSLAEFIRNAYEDFVGITFAAPDTVTIEPHLPSSWGETEARFRIGDGAVTVIIEQSDRALNLVVASEGEIPGTAVLRVRAFGMEKMVSLVASRSDSPATPAEQVALSITVRISSDRVEVNGESVDPDGRYALADATWWEGFSWLAPMIPERYSVMRTASARRILAVREILRDNLAARSILTETDPGGDDWGATSTYTYPAGFPESVLDATYLEVAEDDSTTYFRAEFVTLSEADSTGALLTFVALALNTEEGGANRVGRNALYDFPRGQGYEYVIFVGDGILVEDAHGRTLGEVPPGRGIAFDPATSSLSFALPRFVLPDLPRNSTVTLLVGARDDTGDVGEFRRVNRNASGRLGGGKLDARAPNVYDVVTARVSR